MTRGSVLAPVALTVLAALGLGIGMAFQGVVSGLSGLVTAAAAPAPLPVPSPPRRVVPAPSTAWSTEVVFVDHAAFQRAMWQRPRRTDTLVLDLDGPNSFDVALPLVRSRAEVRAVSGWLVCWVAAANQADAAAAVPALGCEGCTKVDVSS